MANLANLVDGTSATRVAQTSIARIAASRRVEAVCHMNAT